MLVQTHCIFVQLMPFTRDLGLVSPVPELNRIRVELRPGKTHLAYLGRADK